MVASPLRLCLGPRKKIQWLGGLMVASVIVSSIYLLDSRDVRRSWPTIRHQKMQNDTLPNESLRGIFDGETPLATLNETALRRKKQRLLANLLQFQEGEAVATPAACRPRDSVFMVKSHKCSSSTLQSILLRRAEDRGLQVALPQSGVYLSEGPHFDRKKIFMDDRITTYHIMASHMRLHEWDFDAIKEVMKDDAVWITVLRDPTKQFESLYTYYRWHTQFGVDLHGFLENPEQYFKGRVAGSPRNVARNPMLYDNGLDARGFDFGDPAVGEFITAMDERFDLVLLADFFDESLILLKEIMCWTIDDIAYISQNARSKESVENISDAEHAAIRRWNWGDFLLYDHFNRTLLNRIQRFGFGRMSEELSQLHKRKQELSEDCILRTMESGDRRVWYPKGMKMTSYKVNPNAQEPHLCEQLSCPELVFLQKMRDITASRRNGDGKSAKIETSNGGMAEGEEHDDDRENSRENSLNIDESEVASTDRKNGIGFSRVENSKADEPSPEIKTDVSKTKVAERMENSSKVMIVGQFIRNTHSVNSSNLSRSETNVKETTGKLGPTEALSGGETSGGNSTQSHDAIPGLRTSNSARDERRNMTVSSGTRKKQSCQPRDGLLMIKTHKCSSSTLQNILMRRAEDQGLSIALPTDGVYFHPAYKFNRYFVFRYDGKQEYDMMASHTKFDIDKFQDIKSIMKSNVKYVSILRDPARQYESMYSYYHYEKRFGADLHTFLQNPRMYFPEKENKRVFQAGRNPMCHDNGLDARLLEPGDPAVSKFIASMEQIHDLVLIADYFDVSLILLKELMCWSLDDVVYFKQNARSNRSVTDVLAPDVGAIRKWNWADTLLYEHFNQTLWKRVDDYGRERMVRDVAELRARNEELAGDCIAKTLDHSDSRVWYPSGIRVTSFKMIENAENPHLCKQLTRPELSYLRKLRKMAP